MVNSTQQFVPQDASIGSIGALKSGHPTGTRRPFQPRSVNAPSSPSPAKSSKQTNKAQMNPLKSRPETVKKLEVVSENISEWPAIEEEAPTPSLDSEPETNIHPSIFRRRTDDFDHDEQDLDMFTLKRANPVYESDDEEEYMSSASKRQRTAAPSVLHWGDQLSDDEDVGFSVSFLPIR